MRHNLLFRFTTLITVMSMIMTASCGNKTQDKHKEKARNQTDISVETKFIPHEITSSAGDGMTYVLKEESDGKLVISPTSGYFDKYVSKDRMELGIANEGEWCDDLNYPQIEIVITNNSKEILNVNSLKVMVDRSKPDNLPYLFIFQNEDISNSIFIWNEAWFDWGNIIFDYAILRKGESFGGSYDRRLTLPYFKDYLVIDFYNDLIDMGYRPAFDNQYEDRDISWIKQKYMICGNGSDFSHLNLPFFDVHDELFDAKDAVDLFYPFEFSTIEDSDGSVRQAFGFALFYGRLSFTKSDFTKEIKGVIFLSPPGIGGAEMELNEEYDVLLKYDEDNYIIDKPYITSIAPGEAERIRLTLKCPKSSKHRFFLKIENENGLDIRSKDIDLYLLNGRHSTKQPETLKKYPPLDVMDE